MCPLCFFGAHHNHRLTNITGLITWPSYAHPWATFKFAPTYRQHLQAESELVVVVVVVVVVGVVVVVVVVVVVGFVSVLL